MRIIAAAHIQAVHLGRAYRALSPRLGHELAAEHNWALGVQRRNELGANTERATSVQTAVEPETLAPDPHWSPETLALIERLERDALAYDE